MIRPGSSPGSSPLLRYALTLCAVIALMALVMGDFKAVSSYSSNLQSAIPDGLMAPTTSSSSSDSALEQELEELKQENSDLRSNMTRLNQELQLLKGEKVMQLVEDKTKSRVQSPVESSIGQITTEAQEANSHTTISLPTNQPYITSSDARNLDLSLLYHFPDPPNSNLWDNSTLLPPWLKDYLKWHQEQRALMTQDNWQSFKYLIHSALLHRSNGGLTDRLRTLPAMLRIAADTKRIIIIYWNKPHPLDEFLLPPQGGMDWRAPSYMIPSLQTTAKSNKPNSSKSMVQFKDPRGGDYGDAGTYDSKRKDQTTELTALEAFRDIWNVVYTPSPPIVQKVHDNFRLLKIQPGEFATTHIRAMYATHGKVPSEEKMRELVHNAMNCVSTLRPGGPFLVAADRAEALKVALDYGKQKNVTVVHAPNPEDPKHIEHYGSETPEPWEFYDIFIDIYMMAQTRCVSRGAGGFGMWGVWLGYGGSECLVHHKKKCKWVGGASTSTNSNAPKLPIFAAPMEPLKD